MIARLSKAPAILAPLVALGTTVVVSAVGVQGSLTGARALNGTTRAAASAHELAAIASGLQNINGDLYHALTLRAADPKGHDPKADMRALLVECDEVSRLLAAWGEGRATPAQRPRVAALISALARYRDAVNFVAQMLEVDFTAAVSFVRPFDHNYAALMQAVEALVREVDLRQRTETDAALVRAASAIRIFAVLGTAAVLLALLAAARIGRAAMHSHRLSRQNSMLSRMIQIDALTGLSNRRCFDEALAQAWSTCTAQQSPLSLIMLDIDHFKKLNDSQGHRMGDVCLQRLATAIADCPRSGTDTVARYGGEEFAIILPHLALADAHAVAERLRQAVLERALPHPAAGPPGIVTVSLGLASVVPTATGAPAGLIEAADGALYAAKRGGRNRVVVAGVSEKEVVLF